MAVGPDYNVRTYAQNMSNDSSPVSAADLKDVKKMADNVERKMWGIDIRYSISESMRLLDDIVAGNKQRQDHVEDQFQDVIENTTGKDVISAPEIIAARNGEANLKARLDKEKNEVAARLAQIMSLRKTKYIGHRGVAIIAPENTIPSFEKAGELGFWAVECDCTVTSDAEWVVHHDLTVDRMTNGTGNIKDKTLSQIKTLTIDSGSNVTLYPSLRIPTLEEYLDVCIKWELVPVIETKGSLSNANIQSLINLIKVKGLIRKVIITSLTLSHLAQIRNINKEVFLEYAVYTFNSSTIDTAKDLGNAMLGIEHTQINETVMQQCLGNNILVSGWTTNNYNVAKNLEALGVYSIYSDIIC